MDYEKMSNMEINATQIKMKEEFDSIKTKINQLLNKLDTMDVEFNKGSEVLNKRLQR